MAKVPENADRKKTEEEKKFPKYVGKLDGVSEPKSMRKKWKERLRSMAGGWEN